MCLISKLNRVSGRFGLLPVRPPPIGSLTCSARSAPWCAMLPLACQSAWSECYLFAPLPWLGLQIYYRPTTSNTKLNSLYGPTSWKQAGKGKIPVFLILDMSEIRNWEFCLYILLYWWMVWRLLEQYKHIRTSHIWPTKEALLICYKKIAKKWIRKAASL